MSRAAPALVLAVALAAPATAPAAPTAAGRIQTDEATIEILGRPVKVGEKVETPEGWLRVEEAGPEDGEVGSFAVVAADSFGAPAAAASADGVASAGAPADRKPASRDCRAERSAYLSELWRASGIEVSRPDAVIEGLEAGSAGPAAGFAWFALATDAFRPLAWSSALRARAEALARCVRGE
ncbi:MAG TPA: hypothetical protein VFL83_10195 [Anaeromyxobacter sp.]|nr:hypothetical protein [Anaeromyxobacter sp.]